MACDHYGPLISAYVDDELDEEARADVEGHMGTCAACAAEMQALLRLRKEMGQMVLREPPQVVWDEYPACVATRAWRNIGWVCVVGGTAAAVVIGVVAFACDPEVPALAKGIVGLMGVGLLSLLLSVAKQRCREAKTDPYTRILR